ncbi:MAG: hypothetical protein AAFX85_04595, partial [Pseudomonadota bacterium]
MSWRLVGVIAALLWGFTEGQALGAPSSETNDELTPSQRAYERFDRSIDGLYQQALTASDDANDGNARGDVATAVGDCRYLDQFKYLDMFDYEQVERDRQRCAEQVAERYPDHPEVMLYQLEALDGQDLIGQAEAMLERGQTVGWTNAQAARLYELLSRSYEEQDARKAGYYANAAIQLDLFSDVRNTAARWLASRGRGEAARQLMRAPRAERPLDYASEIPLLLELEDTELALARYESLRADDSYYYDELALARQLLRYDQPTLAMDEYAAAVSGDWFNDYKAQVLYEKFQVALTLDDREAALEAYDALREQDWSFDSLLRMRLTLARAFPDVPWTWRDLPGGLMALGVVFASWVVPLGLLIAPVHYVGLLQRQRIGVGAPVAPKAAPFAWRLPHAWVAISLVILANLVALYVVDPSQWTPGVPPGDSPAGGPNEASLIVRLTTVGILVNVAVALLMLPFAGGIGRLASSTWPWSRVIGVAVIAWVALRVLTALALGMSGAAAEVTSVVAQVGNLQQEVRSTVAAIGVLPAFVLVGLLATSARRSCSVACSSALS